MLVAGQEQFVPHGVVRRNQVITRERHPVHHLVIFRNVGIKYPECADYLATRIRQKRILNVVGRPESFKDLARVIRDRCRIKAMRLQCSERELQLDELVAAIGSPIGAAAENQQ
jgi:hypothetical protein